MESVADGKTFVRLASALVSCRSPHCERLPLLTSSEHAAAWCYGKKENPNPSTHHNTSASLSFSIYSNISVGIRTSFRDVSDTTQRLSHSCPSRLWKSLLVLTPAAGRAMETFVRRKIEDFEDKVLVKRNVDNSRVAFSSCFESAWIAYPR
jgi:hypothetical protein